MTLLLLPLTAWPAAVQRGRIETRTITSSALTNNLYGDPATRSFRVYLPPGYDTSSKRYPVVYALHGWGLYGDETQLLNGGTSDYGVANGMQAALDKMIWERSIGEMIVVFPNANNKLFGSFYLSSPVIGDYETYLSKDLVTLVDSRYRTRTNRESRGITGYSMGGWGAMHLAFKSPDVFSVAVPEAGRYNARCQQSDTLARQLAHYHPTNYTQFMALGNIDIYLCAHQAMFAGLLPNPQRPFLYTDYPYEWVNGQAVFSESADQRCREQDVLNGDLPRYLLQPVRLNGIKIVHGLADTGSPVINAREFTNALHAAGVEFEYEEHSGRHDYLPNLALPFLSTHLQGVERYLAPTRLTLSWASNGLQMTFLSQTNAEYAVESAAVLGVSGTNWSERTRVSGAGRRVTVNLPCQGRAEFFRVIAAANPAPAVGAPAGRSD